MQAEFSCQRELEQIHLFIAEKLSKREHEQTHLFIAEKLSKRELEQTHLFIAECSLLWIKSVQPALDKISAAENGKCFNAIANLFDIAEAQPKMGEAKPETSINYSAFLILNF